MLPEAGARQTGVEEEVDGLEHGEPLPGRDELRMQLPVGHGLDVHAALWTEEKRRAPRIARRIDRDTHVVLAGDGQHLLDQQLPHLEARRRSWASMDRAMAAASSAS